ncbi:MAG: hypothetical protein IH899_08265 [Planctomycetes bacterium]|nr:hypothetical protein [Planctomycetota bacterium]
MRVFILTSTLVAFSGCSLFQGGMQLLFSRSQRNNAKGTSILRPLRKAYDAVELEIYFVERPKSDPLLGEMLWRDIAPIGTLSPEVRRELKESGFRVGHTSSTPPPALETLLGLRAEISDEAGQKLCPVAGSADVWTETNQLCLEIKRHWHRVHQWHETQLRQRRP